MRVCKWCNQEKPDSEFGRHKNSPDGFRSSCKECTNKRNKDNKLKPPVDKDELFLDPEWIKQNEDSVTCCRNCGGFFRTNRGRSKIDKYCSKECSYEAGYHNIDDPIKKKAVVVGANLLMGKGKQEFLIELIAEAIDKPCKYCGDIVTIENMSVDHKEAYASKEIRRSKKENAEIRRHMDRKDNLQIICKRCNQLKGAFDHDDYLDLMEFMSTRPVLMERMVKRLSISQLFFKRGKQ